MARPEPEDARAVYEAVVESIDALREFPSSQPWALAAPSFESSLAFCKAAAENHEKGTDFPYLIWKTSDSPKKTLVGCCGLHRPSWKAPSFELGYWCRTSMARTGFATEAVSGLIAYARDALDAKRISAFIDSRNLASQRVAQKNAMVLEGELRNYWVDPDLSLSAALVYSVVSTDPRPGTLTK